MFNDIKEYRLAQLHQDEMLRVAAQEAWARQCPPRSSGWWPRHLLAAFGHGLVLIGQRIETAFAEDVPVAWPKTLPHR